ncbi:contact-dependent growth inhibition system immunity protein [Acetonema longum]|uniref:CdiI immunity protein domain-containing protein n=1 Tax=Acetonema longum DSM 6540 TaxID=1009370 RepID=F7NHZ5_9FIRM|nr:contact-dependent growth inhibition system immunity protein [Acetonema longum]EGO64336.1 hypothetical protein ALO_08465 [Acetonema longum DSM 6540]
MTPEWKELKNFLGGTFHQDITSPEEALEDYIESVDKDWIQTIMDITNSFLESNLTEEEKNKFIQTYAEIYFPAVGRKPVEWLEDVAIRFKKSLSDRDKGNKVIR